MERLVAELLVWVASMALATFVCFCVYGFMYLSAFTDRTAWLVTGWFGGGAFVLVHKKLATLIAYDSA